MNIPNYVIIIHKSEDTDKSMVTIKSDDFHYACLSRQLHGLQCQYEYDGHEYRQLENHLSMIASNIYTMLKERLI